MLLNKEAILEVARYADTLDRDTSSHWRDIGVVSTEHPLKKDPFDLVYGARGFSMVGPIGSVSMKVSPFHRIMHAILQFPIRRHGGAFPSFKSVDKAAASILRRQARAYDKDVLRHTMTMAMLLDNLPLRDNPDPIVVIGDGFGTMASLIMETLPDTTVILVNLTKTLLVDLAFLYKAFPDSGYAYVETPGDIQAAVADPAVKVVAVRADFSSLLQSVPIALGINIFSMMEMDPPVTAKYFEYLRKSPASTRTAFYCCNRDEKRIEDGTITRFLEYPWHSEDEILLDGQSPWDTLAYRARPPFYYRLNSVRHRLAWLSKP
jgi:hypothetical protein